ncbi:MAG: hypothetical protein HOV79_02045, partial [Hamadaea sp.]|nr:hypothetical protein [Hamadaea sp.]
LQPRLRGFTLSGDGSVLAVTARRETTPYLMRFGAADGARLPAERQLTDEEFQTWAPNLDRAGRHSALAGSAGVRIADLADGSSVTLDPLTQAPYVSGDAAFGEDDPPIFAELSADGGTVAFQRSGALWLQPAHAGAAAKPASPGLDGRIGDPVAGEGTLYPEQVTAPALSADGRMAVFLSASTAFVAPRGGEPTGDEVGHLYRTEPADVPAPTWPTGASVTTEPGTTSVTVSWPAASSTTTSYDVNVDGVRKTSVPATQALIGGLTPGSTVEIAVIAKDAAGRASVPLTASVTLQTDVPPGDAPLSASAVGARVTLTWEAATVSGLSGYRVLRDGAAVTTLPVTTTGYVDTGVAADTSYTYRVAALRGTEEVRLTRDAPVRTGAMTITETANSLPRVPGRPIVALGRNAQFSILGAPGFTATAELTLRTSSEPAARISVPLAEREPGRYSGTWTVPEGAQEILTGFLQLADGAGNALSRLATGLPAAVGGAVRAQVTGVGSAASGVRLQVWSETAHEGAVLAVEGDGDLLIPVLPAADHRLTAIRADGLDAITARTVAVASGQIVDVAVAPKLAASATVTVRAPDGRGLPDVAVTVRGPHGTQVLRTSAEGRALFTGLSAGDDVTVTADVPAEFLAANKLAAPAAVTRTLAVGDTPIVVTAAALPRVVLRGMTTLENGTPVRAEITVGQIVHRTGVQRKVTSGADGRWQVEVFAGLGTPTTVNALAGDGAYAEKTVIVDGTPEAVTLTLPVPSGYAVLSRITVKMLDEAPADQPLDWRNATMLRAGLAWSGGAATPSERTYAPLSPGWTVRLCADGIRLGLSAACASTTVGTDPEIPLAVTLTEHARFTARVVGADGTPVTGQVQYSLQPKGGVSAAYSATGPDLRISLPAAGDYTLTVWAGDGRVVRSLHAGEGVITSLGTLVLATSTVVDAAHTQYFAATDAVMPGALAELRLSVAYTATGDHGTARITLPEGVTVGEGAVLRDGAVAADVTIDGGTLVVPLPNRQHQIRIFARTPGESGRVLAFPLSVTGTQGTELVGTALVRSGYISLTAKDRTASPVVPVSGQAPPNSTVIVREDGRELVRAQASAGGVWHAIVDLGDPGDDVSHHLLRAEAATAGTTLTSAPVDVVVDPHAATLQSITLAQDGKAQVTYPTADGVARFPFTFVPAKQLQVTAVFDGPVTDVAAQIGSLSATLQPVDGLENTWRASLIAPIGTLGDVFVTYQPVIERPDLPVPPMPTEAIVDPAQVTLADPVVDGDTISQTFTAPVPKIGPDARVTGRFTVTKLVAGYTPSAADLALAKAAGHHAYEVLVAATPMDMAEQSGQLTVLASGVVDLATLYESGQFGTMAGAVPFSFWNGVARGTYETAFTWSTRGDNAYSLFTAKDKYGQLADLQAMATHCASAPASRTYTEKVESLQRQAYGSDALSIVTNVAALVLAPATFGLGTIAVWGITAAISKVYDMRLANELDALQRQMVTDTSCRYKSWPWPGNQPRERPDSPDASPAWIYDPSGIAYEGTLDRPVEGVTATLLTAPTASWPGTAWNAAEYGQTNPVATDAAGHYGWDVPEGWWKVVYTKPGYRTAQSAALRVLPPHTDVHVAMVREELAAVDRITADDTGLTVRFTQPIRVDQSAGLLAVTTPQGDPVGGTWSAVDASAPPAGHPYGSGPLAIELRFTGEHHHGDVVVTVGQQVQDQAGRALAAAVAQTTAVSWSGPDTAPPVVTITGLEDGPLYRLGQSPAPGCATVDDGSGVAREATLTVTGGSPEGVGVYTATCSFARDTAGNEAEPVSATWSVTYVYEGLFAPVDPDALNRAYAGRAIPIRWRLTAADGTPVTTLTTAVLSTSVISCATGRPIDTVTEYASSTSGLQNLGNGMYQINWKSPASFAGSCRALRLDLGEGGVTGHGALFQFR